jgi:DNA helicase-2/ATP-dependent DNA helicase PcrA
MSTAIDELVAGLNPVQAQAVLAPDGPILIVAGAGSGKTRVITNRVARLLRTGVPPHRVLAITFTNKAAGEMRERIGHLVGTSIARDMWIMTFHASCARILRIEAERIGLRGNFTIYDDGDQQRVLSQCLKELNVDPRRFTPRQIAVALGFARSECVDARTYLERSTTWPERQIAAVYAMYVERLRTANALDFDDLIMQCVRVFEQSPEALNKWQDRFHHIVVDEYQDTNHAQYRFVSLLAAKRRNLCVVGDEDQSVYAFRGASIRNILEFERDYPDARVFKLEQNYRSTQTILGAANAVIRNNLQRKEKRLFTDRGPGRSVTRYQAEDEHDEAHFVASEIARLTSKEGVSGRGIAVFYRTNAQSRVLEEVFFRYGIPYRVVGGLKFYERKEVRDAIAYLRAAHNPADRVSIERAVAAPRRGVGEGSLAKLRSWASAEGVPLAEALGRADEVPGMMARARNGCRELARVITLIRARDAAGAPLAEVVKTAIEESGYLAELQADKTIESQGRVENLQELVGVAAEFASRDEGARLAEFLERTSLISEVDLMAEADEVVTLMTLHNAKGLEFPVVFLTGLEEGVFPHMRSLESPDALEEERRLAYVGITRAQQRLYLCHAWARSLWGGTNYNPVSRFIGEIPHELVEVLGDTRRPRDRGWESRRHDRDPPPRPREGWRRQRATDEWERDEEPVLVNVMPGDEVHHEAFGTGKVLDVKGAGADAEVTVRFEEGTKKLLVAYANLTKAQ